MKVSEAKPEVRFTPDQNHLLVSWKSFTFAKELEDGSFACYVPGFRIAFGASTRDEALAKTSAMIEVMFDQFFLHNNQKEKPGIKNAALHLRKLGFISEESDMLVMRDLLNSKLQKEAKLTPRVVNTPPRGFEAAEQLESESNLEVAY